MSSGALPFDFVRLTERIYGNTLDSIVVMARSRGRLSLPGRYDSTVKPSGFSVKTLGTNNDRIEAEEKLIGSADSYSVVYEIINHNDSPAFAWIEQPAIPPSG